MFSTWKENDMAPKAKPQPKTPTKPKLSSLLIRLTPDQHELIKNATHHLADEVGLPASVAAFVLKAATDRAIHILGNGPE